MDDREAQLRYMRMWVRMNSKADCTGWSGSDIIEAYSLLPMPSISLQEWAALCEYDLVDKKLQDNLTAVNMLASVAPDIVTLEKDVG